MPCFCWTSLDDDTIRTWHRLYLEEGIEGLAGFGHEGSACRLSDVQQDKLRTWITETLPRTTREVGAGIETECGITYESRSGLIALLDRLGMEHRKPKAVSSKLDPDKQAAFIKGYENFLNQLGDGGRPIWRCGASDDRTLLHPGRSRCSSTER